MTTGDVKRIESEMSLWRPQMLALRKLGATLSQVDLTEEPDLIAASLPGDIQFDMDFASFCFELATGTGKTRLLGACIAYLYRRFGFKNFFILTPGETIYRKFRAELVKSHPKYLFKGLHPFPSPRVITGEDYHWRLPDDERLTVYLFNIQKVFNPRTDLDFRFHRFKEQLGASFADILREMDDLVILMDESHRYRGTESTRVINGLEPILGLEYTATPVYAGNVIVRYGLKQAIEDGLVKRVRAVYRENDASYAEELEEVKLRDGLRRHLAKREHLQAYCKNRDLDALTPIAFVNTYRGEETGTRPIEHAEEIRQLVESKGFMDGIFRGKTVVIHSESEEEEERKLLELERPGSPYEVVIHVNKLREGWDIKNIFTIIPLRPSISSVLTQQTIGRGVRLPFGNKRPDADTGEFESQTEEEIFTLDVICYQPGTDNYARIIEAARKLDATVDTRAAEDEEPVERREITPIQSQKYRIVVPRVVSQPSGEVELETFTPEVRQNYADVETVLRGLDVADISSAPDVIGAATSAGQNQLGQLVGRLIERVDELSYDDKQTVLGITESYLGQIPDLGEDSVSIEAFLQSHHGRVYEDLEEQIRDKLRARVEVKHLITGDAVSFVAYEAVVRKEGAEVHWNRLHPDATVERLVVCGYEKTIFPKCTFDSRQEKWFADIIHLSDEVEKWVRVPRGQLSIVTAHGGHSPDFIVETGTEVLLVEIKKRQQIRDRSTRVFGKAREAARWCELVSSRRGKSWSYKLIPHDVVRRDRDLSGILSHAVPLQSNKSQDSS